MVWAPISLLFLVVSCVSALAGPHASIANSSTPQERFLAHLLDTLWFTYKDRVSFVSKCEAVLRTKVIRREDKEK
jgi:hypothetical protein